MTKFSLRYPLLWNFTTRHFIGRKVAQKFHFQGMHRRRSFFHLLDLTASKGAYIAYGIYQPWKDFKEAFLHQFWFQAKKEYIFRTRTNVRKFRLRENQNAIWSGTFFFLSCLLGWWWQFQRELSQSNFSKQFKEVLRAKAHFSSCRQRKSRRRRK